MANFNSKQASLQDGKAINSDGERNDSLNSNGLARMSFFDFTATSAVSANQTILLHKLPPAVRVTKLVIYSNGNTGTSVDVGNEQYKQYSDDDGTTTIAKDATSLADGISLVNNLDSKSEFATRDSSNETMPNVIFRAVGGVEIIATIKGTALASGKEIHGWLEYAAL